MAAKQATIKDEGPTYFCKILLISEGIILPNTTAINGIKVH